MARKKSNMDAQISKASKKKQQGYARLLWEANSDANRLPAKPSKPARKRKK